LCTIRLKNSGNIGETGCFRNRTHHGKNEMIRLDDRVKDTANGFEDIAVIRTEWLYECTRIEM